jgi:hypothetical protein
MPLVSTQLAIADPIGHGALGLRSGLGTLRDLYSVSNAQKQQFVEIRLGKFMTGWSVVSGSVYKVALNEVWDGRRLDVVAVRTEAELLTRVDGTPGAGQFSFDVENQISGEYRLQVRLTDGTSPAGHSVKADFAFYYSDYGCYQPALEDDAMIDGDLDIWTDPVTPTNYTAAAASGATATAINRDSSTVFSGSFSAKLTATLVPGGHYRWRTTTSMVTVAGQMYRFSGYYRTDQSNGTTILPVLSIQDGTNFITANGRDFVSATDPARFLTLADSRSAWSHFSIDFIATAAVESLIFGLYNPAAGGTSAGSAWFDKLQFRRIRQFVYYEPRLGSVPQIQRGRNTIFFDPPQIGSGTLTLRNGDQYGSGDGYFQTLFGRYIAARGDVIHRTAGRYPNGGNEILLEDMLVDRGVMTRPEVADDAVSLNVDSQMVVYKEKLPLRKINPADAPSGESRDTARGRLLIFGGSFGCRPTRIAKSGTTGYGTYEGVDPKYVTSNPPTVSATGLAYSSEEAAGKASLQEQVSQAAFSTADATIIQMNTDIKTVRIRSGVNDLLDFDQGAGALVAQIPAGLYCVNSGAPTLTSAIQAALNAAGTGFTVTYSDTTHKYTIAKSAGTLNLRLTSAAANASKSAWRTIGFTATTDKTGALSYTADTAMFTDCDSDHIVRMNIVGYKDDASGTYTGSAGATITNSMDVAYFLLRKVFGLAAARFDLGALANVRSLDRDLKVTIGKRSESVTDPDTLELGEILSRLENSSGIDCIWDGDRFTFVRRDNTTPSTIVDIYDRDIVAFKALPYEEDDLASTVTLGYEDDTNTGVRHTVVNESAQGLVLLGGIGSPKIFETYNYSANVNARLPEFVANTENVRRRFILTVKGVGMSLRYMDKIRINRSKYLGRADDPSNQVVARVLNFVKDSSTWKVQLSCAAVLTGVTNGW